MKTDLISGNITRSLLGFAAPMMIGNLLQQIYSIADTLIVGRVLGENALAAVGSTYTLTTFLYSVIIGMCMGSGGLVSYCTGKNDRDGIGSGVNISFVLIGTVSVLMQIITLAAHKKIMGILDTPTEIFAMTADYLKVILWGMFFVFLYNFYAYMLRASGNSTAPLIFLGTASAVNILLDVIFVMHLGAGVKGAAYATVAAQAVSGIGIAVYSYFSDEYLRIKLHKKIFNKTNILRSLYMSSAAAVQQSVMNFGILMIQGLVNSFGTAVMAAFTVAVKIDTLAYMPAQEFGNAFSLFVSGNFGAGKQDRIREGVKKSFFISVIFCIFVSVTVIIFSDDLMRIFVDADETEIISIGAQYLSAEGAFYAGIGILFLFYGFFRGINKPEISLILTIISLGTRVALAYALSGINKIGVFGIWISIPIGWALADITGCALMKKYFMPVKNSEDREKGII